MRLLLFLAAAIAAAQPSPFEGRWILQVDNEPRARVWWLEVTGLGNPWPIGRFVGAPGGGMDTISNFQVQANELLWTMEKRNWTGEFRATLSGGKLQGSRKDSNGRSWTFTGFRAPVIKDNPNRTYRRGEPVELLGPSLDSWTAIGTGPIRNWKLENGILRSEKGANNIANTAKFWNFQLHAEFRVAPGSNGGIGLRNRYEIQIQDDYGKPIDSHIMGALYSRVPPSENACIPATEWQTYDITLIGRTLTVVLNGKTVLDRVTVEGLTAFASDPFEDQPGAISLQGDHGVVEFRKLTVTPLLP